MSLVKLMDGYGQQLPICNQKWISKFSHQIDWIFPGKPLNPIFGTQDEGFSEFRSR